MLRSRKRFENPFQQYWRILLKRRLTVVVCFVSALAITILYNENAPPRFRSSTKLLIEDSTRWLGIKDTNRVSMDWYMTQFEILKSLPIVTRVIDRLDLTASYSRNRGMWEVLRDKVLRRPLDEKKARAELTELVPLIQQSVSVRPQTSSGLVVVSVSASSPELARDITDTLVEVFIEENMQARIALSMQATEYLTERLQKISDRIEQQERKLDEFERAEGIDMVDQSLLPLDTQQFRDVIDRYLQTRSQRWEQEERLKVLQSIVAERDFSGVVSPHLRESAVGERSLELFEAQLRLEKLDKDGYGEKHPFVIEASETIATVKKRLVFESRALINGLRAEIAALEERERSLSSLVEELKPDIKLARQKRAEWDHIKRDLDIQNSFYESYNEQLSRMQVIDDGNPTSVRLVESASLPTRAYSPNKRYNLIVGTVVGALLALFLSFFREYLDDTMKSADDVQDYLELPVVGTIPRIRGPRGSRGTATIDADASGMVSEAYRSLRTNLQFFEDEGSLCALLITSRGPGEGKSTTAANTAIALVQTGKRVCLIDGDLRKPVLHKLFQTSNRFGITSLFAGVTDKKRLLHPCAHDGLFLLPCGPVPPNPAELLASKRMEEAIANLRRDFDYLIFDSPPVLAVTDALVLSSMVDGVLIVIHAGETRIRVAQQTVDALTSIKANIVGSVLNSVSPKQFDYYPFYSKYYGYAYGTKQPKSSDGPVAAAAGKKA